MLRELYSHSQLKVEGLEANAATDIRAECRSKLSTVRFYCPAFYGVSTCGKSFSVSKWGIGILGSQKRDLQFQELGTIPELLACIVRIFVGSE